MKENKIDQKKFLELMQNMDFIKSLVIQESIPDVQNLFKKEGIELSEQDVMVLGKIINRTILKEDIINDEELSKIYGGTGSFNRNRKLSFMGKISEAASASMGIIGGFNNGNRGWRLFSKKKKGPPVLPGINKHAIAQAVHEGTKNINRQKINILFINT